MRKNHSVGNFFEELYHLLSRNYRSEYIYKNQLTLEILSQYHSEKATVLTEFRSANCLADALVLNGTSCAYEIKTELDTLDRLERQLAAYQQMFDQIYVITSELQAEKLILKLDSSVGIVVLKADLSMKRVRLAHSNKADIDNGQIFDSLRAKEYLNIVHSQFGFTPDVPNTLRYTACKELFMQLSPEIAHNEMVRVLKCRIPDVKAEIALNLIPKSLSSLYLNSKFTEKQNNTFMKNLRLCHSDSLLN